jgi:hypothetical protein
MSIVDRVGRLPPSSSRTLDRRAPAVSANVRGLLHSTVAALLLAVAAEVSADPWEPADNTALSANANVLLPFAPPQLHDLANVGGAADLDWFRVNVELNRSYDVSIGHGNIDWVSGPNLQRFSSTGGALLQGSTYFDRSQYRRTLRWVSTSAGENMIKVTGTNALTGGDFYEIILRETTLYCPRYNNSGGQVSVLIVQRAANDGGADCVGTAFFLNEGQAVVATKALTIGPNAVLVHSLPGVPGLAGQKGGAQIAHTCGIGGLKAKLVALEPTTGFSFDTICSPRD